ETRVAVAPGGCAGAVGVLTADGALVGAALGGGLAALTAEADWVGAAVGWLLPAQAVSRQRNRPATIQDFFICNSSHALTRRYEVDAVCRSWTVRCLSRASARCAYVAAIASTAARPRISGANSGLAPCRTLTSTSFSVAPTWV